MNISSVNAADLERLATLFRDVFCQPPWNESWDLPDVRTRLREMFESPGFYGIGAFDGAQLIGMAVGNTQQWNRSRELFIKEVCIRADRQRGGIGSAMIARMRADMIAMGVAKICCLTDRDSIAETFYRKNGFYLSGRLGYMGLRLKAEGAA
jgi:ribosomal protein S18 acetylase RimI-like enzyme